METTIELTIDNLLKPLLNSKCAIQLLKDKMSNGDIYKSTWKTKHVNPTKNTNILYVLDSIGNIVLQVDTVRVKNNKYWIVESLINMGFNINIK